MKILNMRSDKYVKMKQLWYVKNKGNVINISTSRSKADDFLWDKLKGNGDIYYVEVPEEDWNSEKVTTSTIVNYAKKLYTETNKMKKIIKLTEKDLSKIVKKVILESEDMDEKYTRYSKPYTHFKSIDERLTDMINELHSAYGLGVASDDEYLRKCADEGLKAMGFLRKAKELVGKGLKEKFEVLKSMQHNKK